MPTSTTPPPTLEGTGSVSGAPIERCETPETAGANDGGAMASNGASEPGRLSVDELYERARAEQALALWVGGPTAPWAASVHAFQSAYPGIAVTIEGGFSNVLTPKIDQQISDGKLAVDLAVLQTLQDFGRWKREGRLLRFVPEGWETIDATFKDPEGAWVGITVNMIAYTYNSERVPRTDVPRSAPDFLKPQFKGKAVSAYPADDDVTLYRFYTTVQRYGWEFMDRYMANDPTFIQGHLGVLRSIAAGESLVSFDMIAALTLSERAQEKPTELAFPSLDPMPIWPQGAGIFKDAPHAYAAKLFLTWFLGKEQQAKFVGWSVRADVPPPAGLQPIFRYLVDNKYADFVADETRLADLRKRFESYTGPVKNVGGVR